MSVRGRLSAMLAMALALVSAPALSHHSFAMFDQNKLIELKGVTVLEFKWGNPHVFLIVQSGQTRYGLECSSPSALTSSGWRFNSVKAGDKIDVVIFPLRNGKAGGALKSATLPNGQKLGAL